MQWDDEELSEEAVEKHNQEVKRQEEEFVGLLSHPGNRYWLWKLMSECKVFHTLSVSNPHDMAILSGKRDIGLWVLNEILNHHPEAFNLMQQEAKEREQNG